jgi:hypothetical protein
MPVSRNDYPRVTTVLHEGFPETGLETWAVKEAMKKLTILINEQGMGLEEAIKEAKRAGREIMENAARRGTAVHHLIEGKTEGQLAVQEGDMESVRPMYESFLKWAADRNFKPVANEIPIWSDKHGYKGTLDCIGWVDGRLELIDWKTSNSIRLGYRCQTAAYWYGFKESANVPGVYSSLNVQGEVLQGIRIVRFGGRSDKETQLKDLVEYDELIIDGEDEISIDFNAFLAAKRLHDWKLKRK